MVTGRTVVNTVRYKYNSDGQMTSKVITPASGSAFTYYFTHSDNNTSVQFTAGGRTVTSHSKTDSFGRKVFDEIQLGTDFVTRQFTYHAGQVTEEHQDNAKLKSAATTQLVSQIVLSDGRTLSYEYDEEERITKVTDSFEGTTEYTYDSLGQLLTETVDGVLVNTMTYDNYGNILSKNGVAYEYCDDAWKDKLTAVGDDAIEYDAQGNPVSYLGHTLAWEKGRQLKTFDNITYTYDANGIRTSKTVNGVKHTYTLDGTKILRETWGSNTLIPLYDNEDTVCGIVYNNTPYYFLKNLQGDIIAIVNKDGDTVARYSYDAWGKCTVNSDTSGCSIATINPYRYRGYYYDVEIGLYYLQSRYYDACVGRFVNADVPNILSMSELSADFNYYCYCVNNPINESDNIGLKRLPIIVAFGIQLEMGLSIASCGIELVFANSSVYVFTYGGMAYGPSAHESISWIKANLTTAFSAKSLKKHLKSLLQLYMSLCVFAVFSTSRFSTSGYSGPFVGASVVVPTIWGLLGRQIGVKSYVSGWSSYTCVGIGFVWPATLDWSGSYTKYTYRGTISMPAKIKQFVNNQTKGLKP